MAQHDYVIDNSTGANVRADINSVLQAISSNNSGSSAPSTTYALQSFANTTDSMLQLRNAANNAFVNLRKFDGSLPLPDGSVSSPSLFFNDDTNTGIFSSAANHFCIATDGSEVFTIDEVGRVGIGDTNPNNELNVKGATPQIRLEETATGNSKRLDLEVDSSLAKIGANQSAQSMAFSTASNEAMRIDSSGRLLLGTSSARSSGGGVNAHLQLEGTTSQSAEFLITRNTADTFSPTLGLVKTRGTSVGSNTAVQDNDVLGTIQFRGADGSDIFGVGASIFARVNGTPSDGTDMPAELVFATTADGASSPSERMSIDSSGHIIFNGSSSQKVAFGVTDNTKYAGFGRHDGAAQDVGLNFYTTTNAGTTFVNHFRIDHNGDLLGTDTDGISSISDSRVKTDITDYTYDLAKFKQFAPKQFNWKNPEYHGEKTNVKGFLAQDLEAIDTQWVGSSFIEKDHPDYDLVDKSKNGQDEDVGVAKTSKFGGKDAMYISVIHQLIAKIETLETKVAALEAA